MASKNKPKSDSKKSNRTTQQHSDQNLTDVEQEADAASDTDALAPEQEHTDKDADDFATVAIEDKTELELPPDLSEPEEATDAEIDDDKTVIMPPAKGFIENSDTSPEPNIKKTKIGMSPAVRETVESQQERAHKQQSVTQPSASKQTKIGPGMLLKGRYDLFEKLGEGGMGVVYKALDRRDVEAGNTIFIAIKVLNDEYKSNPDVLKALHSEARKTQQLAHPNIITVFDFDRDSDAVFMTMEYMNGATLDYLIKSNPNGMNLKDALHIIEQLGNALSYAHSNLVIHCDFKPGNIFVDRANHVKILDFGIARLSSLTQANRFDAGILGALTPAYASLEMLQGEPPDPRDDIYAFACVIYELLTGKHPFNRNDARRAKYNNQKPKEIKSLNRKQWQALKKALAFDRAQRTRSIEDLIHGLHSRNDTWVYALGGIAVAAGLAFYFSDLYLPGMQPAKQNETEQTVNTDRFTDRTGESDTIVSSSTFPPQDTTAKKPMETSVAGKNKLDILPSQQQTKVALGKIKVWTAKSRYKIGENLEVNFTVDKPMYVRVALIDSNGEVTELFPNPYQENNFCQPGKEYQIPPKNSDLELTIFGPAGVDKIRAIAKPKPFTSELMKFSKSGELIGTDKDAVIIGATEYRIR